MVERVCYYQVEMEQEQLCSLGARWNSTDHVSDQAKNDSGISQNASESAACMAGAEFLTYFGEPVLFKLNCLPFARTSPNVTSMTLGQTSHAHMFVKLMWKRSKTPMKVITVPHVRGGGWGGNVLTETRRLEPNAMESCTPVWVFILSRSPMASEQGGSGGRRRNRTRTTSQPT